MNKRFKIAMLAILIGVFIIGMSAGVMASSQIHLFINNKEIKSDVDPVIMKERVMIPLRVVSENLGAKVSWDNKEKNVNISTSDKIWSNSPDPWKSETNIPIIVVSRYLSMLQGNVCDADNFLRDNLQKIFSQAVVNAPEPYTKVWYFPNAGMGSSVRRLNWEILDARIVLDENRNFSHYEVAARLKYYDPISGEPAYHEMIKIYNVIQEEYTEETDYGTAKYSHLVIDSEKTLSEKKLNSADMPSFYN